MKITHKTRLLSYLEKYGSITTLQAIRDLGNTILSATIFNLRKDGLLISSNNIKVPTRWGTETTVAKYVLEAH